MFELFLCFRPSFHRHCSIRVAGDLSGEATFEAPPSGLLPGVAKAVAVDEHRTAALRASCQSMLEGWDERWSRSGLDGITVDGTFETLAGEERAFMLWSPSKSSGAHAMLAAVLACFPPEQDHGAAAGLLDIVRSYFGLQPVVAVMLESPLRIRLAPWLHHTHAFAVEQALRALPEEARLVIDASGVERFGPALPRALPMAYLRKRVPMVRWVARPDAAQALFDSGVMPSDVDVAHQPSLTSTGQAIVLGGLIVSSSDLISLAKDGTKIELTRALRQEYRITVAQASQAAGELVDLVSACGDLAGQDQNF